MEGKAILVFVQAEPGASPRPHHSVSCCFAESTGAEEDKIKIMMLCVPNSTTDHLTHDGKFNARLHFGDGEMTTTCMYALTRRNVSAEWSEHYQLTILEP